MTASTTAADNSANASKSASHIFSQRVIGSRRFSNYWWATIISIGATGFVLSGLSSYLKINFIPFAKPTELAFIPQGAVMGFYGTLGLLLALYLWAVISLDVGGGYNEFNSETGAIKIFRWGFPGKNRQIEINLKIKEVQSVQVDLKEGLNPRRALYLRVKGRRDIPLTRVGQPLSISELEKQGAGLARFLEVPLEGL